jgi:secondary thiamine-phosphate synthase enzyme
MQWLRKLLDLPPHPRGLHLITPAVERALPQLRQTELGELHLFLKHTSASLAISENADADVPRDLERALNAIVPESFGYAHTVEGPDDMPAHVKNAILGCSLTIPVTAGRLELGTWQGIYLCEHRNHASRRQIVLTLRSSDSPRA